MWAPVLSAATFVHLALPLERIRSCLLCTGVLEKEGTWELVLWLHGSVAALGVGGSIVLIWGEAVTCPVGPHCALPDESFLL